MQLAPSHVLGSFRTSVRNIGTARLYVLIMLTAGHAVVHWYQQLFSLLIPDIRSTMGLSNVQVGTLNTVRQVASGLTLPSGYLADSYRRSSNVILAAAIMSFGLGYFFIGIAPSYALLLAAITLIGLGTALWHPAAMGSLSLMFKERRGMALSIHGAGASIGDSIVPVIIGAILVYVSWQLTAQLNLIPAIVVALILWITLRNSFVEDGPRQPFRAYAGGLAALVKNMQFVGVVGSNTLSTAARLAVTAFFPLYITETLGYSTFTLGIYLALLYVTGLISQPVMGVISDRSGRKVVLVSSFALMAGLFVLMAVVTNGILLGIVVGGLGCFFYGTTNVTQSAVMDVAGEGVQASTMGVMNLIAQPFTLVTPIMAGVITEEYGLVATFWFAAALQALSTVVLLPIRFKRV
jgi:MFS transporter, FSR family, fosmidomycin resistance protein